MKRTTETGFTLIELMIALLMTALVMTLLFAGLRILSRGWEAAERRQQQISEQFQVQQVLRRLIAQARNERVRDIDSVLQSAFRGEPDQLIFVAPRHQNSADASLLWYRLRLAVPEPDAREAEAESVLTLVLDTRAFVSSEIIDWTQLFDAPPVTAPDGAPAPVFASHRLLVTGPARLELRYLDARADGRVGLNDQWRGQSALPWRIDLSLQPDTEVDGPRNENTAALVAAWSELSFGLKEHSYDVRSF